MSFRDVMRDSVTPFLRPDETVQVVISALGNSPWTVMKAKLAEEFLRSGGGDPYSLNKWRIVAVTPQRILVLAAPNGRRATGVLTEMPRSTRLGPPTGFLTHRIPVEGGALWVIRRCWKDVRAADSLINVGS